MLSKRDFWLGFVLFLVVILSFWTYYTNREIPVELYCDLNSDCVPSDCCHSSSCVASGFENECEGVRCTLSCEPGTLDCGQGSCGCVNNRCSVSLRDEQ